MSVHAHQFEAPNTYDLDVPPPAINIVTCVGCGAMFGPATAVEFEGSFAWSLPAESRCFIPAREALGVISGR